MRYFLFPLISGMLLVALINVVVDPANRWGSKPFSFEKAWAQGDVWVSPIRIEERDLRDHHIAMLDNITLLGLGSSRFLNVGGDMFGEDVRFYNSSVTGATLWDSVSVWQQFKDHGNIPTHVVMYVDTWNFNSNTWQKYRWIPGYKHVMRFLHTIKNPDAEVLSTELAATGEWLAGNFYELIDLISPSVLKASLEETKLKLSGMQAKTDYITPEQKRPALYPAYRSDGSMLFAKADEAPKDLEVINEIGRNIGMGGMYVYMKDWDTDENAVHLLDYLLADMQAHGVNVLLVQPPLQPVTYEIMLEHPEYREIPARYEKLMGDILTDYPDVKYCNALNPADMGCEPTEFMDSSHTLRACARKVVQYCMQETGWSLH